MSRRFEIFGHRSRRWWAEASPEPRDRSIPEAEQLERLGELKEDEARLLERTAQGPQNEMHEPPFRRTWGWWRYKSPEPRNWAQEEATQLVAMERQHTGVLTNRERYIVAHRSDPHTPREMPAWQVKSLHYLCLTPGERRFLGLQDYDHPELSEETR